MNTIDRIRLEALTELAAKALLEQTTVSVRHFKGWSREGFPLPIKRMKEAEDGSVTQEYRPLAILEYVNDVLSGVIAAKQAKENAAKRKPRESKQEQDRPAHKQTAKL